MTKTMTLAELSRSATYNENQKKKWRKAATKLVRESAKRVGAVAKVHWNPGGIAVCGDVTAFVTRDEHTVYVSLCGALFYGESAVGYARRTSKGDKHGVRSRNWYVKEENIDGVLDMLLKPMFEAVNRESDEVSA